MPQGSQHSHYSKDAEMPPLTDSISSLVRWRMRDYASILRAEFRLMLCEEIEGVGRARTQGTSIS